MRRVCVVSVHESGSGYGRSGFVTMDQQGTAHNPTELEVHLGMHQQCG